VRTKILLSLLLFSGSQVIQRLPVKAATPTKCAGHEATIVGTSGDDRLRGTPRRDVIVGLAGNDRIVGWKGRDVICGNAGDDKLAAGPGGDHLSGGLGADVLNDERGDDLSVGGPGPDEFASYICTSNDTFCGPLDRWDDRLEGGSGADEITVSGGYVNLAAHLYLTKGSHDHLTGIEDVFGSFLDETIVGDGGPNVLLGHVGNDLIRGRDGGDLIIVGGISNADTPVTGDFHGGPGADWLQLDRGGEADLRSGRGSAEGGRFRLEGIENLRTNFGVSSTLVGDDGPNVLVGDSGSDTLLGRSGNDKLFGRRGDDQVGGGPGHDRLDGGGGDDTCRNGEVVSNCD
jgi:Ca2+-binding RTX toxin-like protein